MRGEWVDENFSVACSMVGFHAGVDEVIKTTYPASVYPLLTDGISARISSGIVYTSNV